jgi:hypothetical protein
MLTSRIEASIRDAAVISRGITSAVGNDILPRRMQVRAKQLRGAMVSPHAVQ